MGLLDEAIREHLELKLRNGADPEQIAVEEREALEPLNVDSAQEEGTHVEEPADVEDAPHEDAPEPQATVEFDMGSVIDPPPPAGGNPPAGAQPYDAGQEQLGLE